MTDAKELRGLPEVGRPQGGSSVEIYRGVNGRFSYRVVAVAAGDTEEELRAAKALALALEDEIYNEIGERHQRRYRQAHPQ